MVVVDGMVDFTSVTVDMGSVRCCVASCESDFSGSSLGTRVVVAEGKDRRCSGGGAREDSSFFSSFSDSFRFCGSAEAPAATTSSAVLLLR